MADKPIAHTVDGRPLYDNTATVVCIALQPSPDSVYAIRRATEPGYGKLALPGGYHMRGESWEQAVVREVKEEIGLELYPQFVQLHDVVTDEYQNNVILAHYYPWVTNEPVANLDEVLEIIEVQKHDIDKHEWAFPLHKGLAYFVCS